MIVVTGTAGFIGSNLVIDLIERGYRDIICIDVEGHADSMRYLSQYPFLKTLDHTELITYIENNHLFIEAILHLGACSDTVSQDIKLFETLNINYTKALWKECTKYGIPFLYASSAATYGDGSNGYDDNHADIENLKPLNLYGLSKHRFDVWALKQKSAPAYWAGFKFFNVYGPFENHKNSMASVVFHSFNQIQNTNKVKLFRSHRKDIKDGDQSRDFIYVKDVCDVMIHFMEKRPVNGIFNVGTGINRSFKDLALATFSALAKNPEIKYIDTPDCIRNQYQYYTKANIDKLRNAGYKKPFTSLEDGVKDYVRNYLLNPAETVV